MTAIGLTEIYRLSPTLARDQSVWIVVGLAGFLGADPGGCATSASWRPTSTPWARRRCCCCWCTMVVGTTVNGAKLWIRVGGVQVQPGEFAKLLLVDLPGRLPAREARAADDGAPPRAGHRLPRAAPPRPAADDDRHRPGRGRRDERPGHRAAAVRHLPGDAVRGHRPAASTRWSGWRCSRPARGPSTRRRRTCRSGSTIWLDPWKDAAQHRVPDHPVDRVDRRRRRVRRRPGPQLPAR